MTERSGNEVATLVTKAARGAGLPVGYAEILGDSAVWLRGDLRPMLRAIENFANPDYKGARAAVEGVLLGIQANLANGAKRSVLGVDEPVVAHAAARNYAFRLGLFAECERSGNAVSISMQEGAPEPRPAARVDVDDETWARLTDFAALILVPATDASRLAGAGAGLTDND